jgi:predicted DNA-binding protein (MmcQ/YjbR family)
VAARTRKTREAGSSEVEAYCRAKPEIAVSTPFGREPLVFKVAGKMFALLGHLDGEPVVSLKCEPEQGVMLRASFPTIRPGYHLNKQHWNTLTLDGSLPAPLVFELVDHAYDLVANAARRTARKREPPVQPPHTPRPSRTRRPTTR